jgi:hypothetical protein
VQFPTIEDAPAVAERHVVEVLEQPRPLALASLRTSALAELTAVERGIAALRAEHGSTNYDVTTPHGMTIAKARRHAIRLVRFEVPKVVKAKKAELADIREAVQTEGDRIIAALRQIEDPHDALITAEEEKRRIEKEAREAAEAEAREQARIAEAARKAKHESGIATIRGYVAMAQGLTSAQITSGMAKLAGLCLDGFEEYFDAAEAATRETMLLLDDMRNVALAREEAAARIEAQRIEQERIAAEQRAEAERLAAERAELERQRAAVEAERQQRIIDDATEQANDCVARGSAYIA